jgi:sulfofructose kinase
MPHFLSIGHASLDHVFRVDALPKTPTKVRAQAYAAEPGGMAANAAVALVRLGARASFLGPLGDDVQGQAVLAQLNAIPVATHHARIIPGESTSVAAVIVDARGERWIVSHRGSALRAAPDAADLEALVGVDAVLADVRWARGAAPLLKAARQQGILTVVDGDIGDAAEMAQLIAYADIAAFSEPGLRQWAGTDDDAEGLALARQAGCHIALVTHGERGVVWSDDEGLHAMPAFTVEAVDTTGAGDTWHAALALALVERQPLEQAVRFANATAALKVTRPGAWSCPSRDEVEAFLRRHN